VLGLTNPSAQAPMSSLRESQRWGIRFRMAEFGQERRVLNSVVRQAPFNSVRDGGISD